MFSIGGLNIRARLSSLIVAVGILHFIALAMGAETAPPLDWSRVAAGMGEDYGGGSAVDNDGHIYFTSWHADEAKLLTNAISPGSLMLWKFAFAGDRLSHAVLTNLPANSPRVYSRLLATRDNGLLVAMGSDNLLAFEKLDENGSVLWSGGEGRGRGVPLMANTRDGSHLFAAPARGNFAFGTFQVAAGEADLIVLKVTAFGELLWARRIVGTLAAAAAGIGADLEGNVYVAGTYRGSLAIGPIATNSAAGAVDGFIAKYGKDGQPLWLRDVRGDGDVRLGGLAVLNDSTVSVTGDFSDSLNLGAQKVPGSSAFLGRVELDGTFRTIYKLGDRIAPADLVLADDGELVVAGTFNGAATIGSTVITARGGTDYFCAKMSSSAVVRWAKGFGYIGDEKYEGQIALSPAGEVCLALSLRDGLLIDGAFFEGAGASDAVLLKLRGPARPLPLILEGPEPQAALVGASASFSVNATNALRYQWYFENLPIVGASKSNMLLPNVTLANAGKYSVAAINDAGSVRSVPVALAVSGDLPVAVTTLSGKNVPGMVDSTNRNAVRFNLPAGLAYWSAGVIAVADSSNHVIRLVGPDGTATTYAGITNAPGYANGPAPLAQFRFPFGVKVDLAGDMLVADTENNVIRRISSIGFRTVSTAAGRPLRGFRNGPAPVAQFSSPADVVLDAAGNIFVTDVTNHVIRKIGTDGLVVTFAGRGLAGWTDGNGTNAAFNLPYGLAIDDQQNLFVTERGNHTVRKITPQGAVTTIAGETAAGFRDGSGADARFNMPAGIAVDRRGNLYVADQQNHAIRRIDPRQNVATVAGIGTSGFADGTRAEARFNSPTGIMYRNGSLYVTDTLNHSIRRIDLLLDPSQDNPKLSFRLNPATLTIEGVPGATYQIERATPEFGWSAAGSITLMSDTASWIDPDGSSDRAKFYRVVKQP